MPPPPPPPPPMCYPFWRRKSDGQEKELKKEPRRRQTLTRSISGGAKELQLQDSAEAAEPAQEDEDDEDEDSTHGSEKTAQDEISLDKGSSIEEDDAVPLRNNSVNLLKKSPTLDTAPRRNSELSRGASGAGVRFLNEDDWRGHTLVGEEEPQERPWPDADNVDGPPLVDSPDQLSLKSGRSSNNSRGSSGDSRHDVQSLYERPDTASRLVELRKLMENDHLDYYVVPSCDSHQSKYVALSEKRREWISGFTGPAGHAVISKTAAYLITDSRYWIQAKEEVDRAWIVIPTSDFSAPKDWVDWLVQDCVKDSRIGIDSHMIAHETAVLLNSKLARQSKLAYSLRNLIDVIWKDRPQRSQEPIFLHGEQFAGMDASDKLRQVRDWIESRPPAVPFYSKAPPTPAQTYVATLIASLSNIAWLLNLRGQDVPFNPVFFAYLYIGLNRVVLFVDSAKVSAEVAEYLDSLDVERREYDYIWTFLRRREWGEGKILISPQTSYAISLTITNFRYTVVPSFVDEIQAVKNAVELGGLRHAHLRDGAAFVQWLAWMEQEYSQGHEVTEYQAASELNKYRRRNQYYRGPAYEPTSASGPNAALSYHTPRKSSARLIDREMPYLIDSGGQYLDGTCNTTRTVHFGRPTNEQCEAYTRVLQGHIALDSVVFPQGTSGRQLDVLARRPLWRHGLDYPHDTGHGVGSYLSLCEGPHSFSNDVPLALGHVITNEPGFYKANSFGIRIKSTLAVTQSRQRGEPKEGPRWLYFERLTCVPIQTRMVKGGMLSEEERQWIKEHNKLCRTRLEPLLREKDDKRALHWVKREADRAISLTLGTVS